MPKRSIQRDLSESLGKLPPQALDIEVSVLAKILLESPNYAKVKDILNTACFYSEVNQTIYSAIHDLGKDGSPITLLTVSQKLKKLGKLELVGGAYYVAQLTQNFASGADIEYDARILIEHAVKRELINLASTIHNDAYEDTTDAIELFEKAKSQLQTLHDNAFRSSGPQKIKEAWQSTLLTSLPDEHPPILYVDGIPIAWPGGHTLLTGKKKSRKTLFIVWLVSQYLSQNINSSGNQVLIFDTEQSQRQAFRVRERINQLTGKQVALFYLRGKSPEERQEFISETVAHWPTPPQLIICDGIRDMMNDINDPKESTKVIVWLEKLTLAQRPSQLLPPHIINVLHLNKGDSNPRGHIGTELQNKADCSIELELDEKAGCTNVKYESGREKGFPTFSFTHDPVSGLPNVVTNANSSVVTQDDTRSRLYSVFDDNLLNYSELCEQIKANFGVGLNKAKSLIATFLRNGWIVKNGVDRSPNTKYKLMISLNQNYPPEQPPKNPTTITPKTPTISNPQQPQIFTQDDLPF